MFHTAGMASGLQADGSWKMDPGTARRLKKVAADKAAKAAAKRSRGAASPEKAAKHAPATAAREARQATVRAKSEARTAAAKEIAAKTGKPVDHSAAGRAAADRHLAKAKRAAAAPAPAPVLAHKATEAGKSGGEAEASHTTKSSGHGGGVHRDSRGRFS